MAIRKRRTIEELANNVKDQSMINDKFITVCGVAVIIIIVFVVGFIIIKYIGG